MKTNDNRQKAHNQIDHIFSDILPTQGMSERPEQIALSHRMLDALLDGHIALCDAGTGIGKTYAYLVAGAVFHRFRAAGGQARRPLIISTSSIALQNAVLNDYLPSLSALLMGDGILRQPIRAVIRKGKSHYICDERLKKRLRDVDLKRKKPLAAQALLSLKDHLDIDMASHLSSYDRGRVCVPGICDCGRDGCRYHLFLEVCGSDSYQFQICNHNLLLADAVHRNTGKRPIFPEYAGIIIDEAHKLPEAARQMFGVTMTAEDLRALIHGLRAERYLLASEALEETCRPLLKELSRPWDEARLFSHFARLLTRPMGSIRIIQKQINALVSPALRQKLEQMATVGSLFLEQDPEMVFYTAEDGRGGTMLCATTSDLTAQLQATLWSQPQPIILTSGTLSVGGNFRRFKEETGLLAEGRVRESVSPSPFNYQENCLLYLPQLPPQWDEEGSTVYYDALTKEIAALLEAACGHALVLFTSYAAMSAVKERLKTQGLQYPLYALGRNAVHTTEKFKASPGSVLLATGAAWEGFDFPGDCVSLLVIPRLPFARPDALKEKERENYPTLRSFLRAVVVPEMQIKLRQGFGRAIRTEEDTCVVAILDERAAHGRRYHQDAKDAIPEMPMTSSLRAVEQFIRSAKDDGYFLEGTA